jgi:hypothetical protein
MQASDGRVAARTVSQKNGRARLTLDAPARRIYVDREDHLEHMMTAVTFDTLKFAKKLEAAGLPPAQAEAIADAFREATSEELVTRDYLDARLEGIKGSIEAAKGDIIKWVAGLLIAQAALVATLVKLL